MDERYARLVKQVARSVNTILLRKAHEQTVVMKLLSNSEIDSMSVANARAYLRDALAVSPVDFPIQLNAKIGKMLEYELRTTKITKWTDVGKDSDGYNIGVWRGNITTLQIDAIVNAANKYLLGCFIPGHKCIDNVIHNCAGPLLRDECRRLITTALSGQPEATGKARLTLGYNLPARYVIHTVGPIVREEEAEKPDELASCYKECLNLARDSGLRSIAFCCISTGVFGYPKESAARVALRATKEWLDEDGNESMDLILFNVFLEEDLAIYKKLVPRYFSQSKVATDM